MKKSSGIKTVKSNISFAKRLLRKFVKARPAVSQEKKRVTDYFSANYEKINCCSVHIPIDGRLDMVFDSDYPGTIHRIIVPIRSAFLVTCVKEGTGDYRLTWSCSMS
jgi:hypothetical protein